MPRETYPQPGQTPGRPRLVYTNLSPEFGATREQYEERIFRQASHYNIVRLRAGGGSEIATTTDFREALTVVLTEDDHRYLLYVVTENGEAFCMSHKDYAKFAEIYVKAREEKERDHTD